jgi:DNA replication and repair protein RecF
MELKLELVNFRNFGQRKIDISPPSLIVGKNAVGKTNILESIFLISTTNSFKKSKSDDFIMSDREFAKIKLKKILTDHEQDYELRFLKSTNITKESFLDERKVSLAELIGQLPSAVFAPESLHIIKGSPSGRRSFLNITLSQTDSDYLHSLMTFNKVKTERNELLSAINRSQSKREELEFWDNQLVEHGSKIITKRIEFIDFINQRISQTYSKLSRRQEEIAARYKTNATDDYSLDQVRNKYSQIVAASLDRDLSYQTTTRGPHRDDVEFVINDKMMAGVGSQGEVRTLAFVLKVIEREYLESKMDSEPLFLLDDPLSELDDYRAKYLLRKIKDLQAVVTALPEELRGIEEEVEDFQIISLDEKNQ